LSNLTSNIPIISVKGDSYSRGFELGRAAKDMILRNVQYYFYLWSTYSGMEKSRVNELASKFAPIIEKYDSEILQEMRGVSEGAGVSLEEIIAINCRYELVWAQMQYNSPTGQRYECTSMGAGPEVTAKGHTLLGQNWDYKPHARKNCVIVEELQEPDRPNIVMHTEAGILGQKGINSAGIGVTVNALTSDQDKLSPKVPFFVIVRGALNKRTLDQAMLAATSAERAVSGNLMLAQEGGEIVDLELTPDDFGSIFPQEGLISHANNFIDPHCTSRVTDKIKAVDPGSLIRTNRSYRLLQKRAGKISELDFQEILKDHFGYPNSICAHPNPNHIFDFQEETIASVIFDLEDRTITISRGEPCCNPYKEIRFESLQHK